MKGVKKVSPRKHDANLKAKVALEAIIGEKTIAQISSLYSVHPTQIGFWKRQVLAGLPSLFDKPIEAAPLDADAISAPLYQQIGQLKVELDFLKKKSCHLA